MPPEPWASQASPAASSPATVPTITPSTRVETVAVNQRARILMESHSSKWFSPSRRNHQPANVPAMTGTTSAAAPKSSDPAGSAANTGIEGSGPTAVPSAPAWEPTPRAKPAPDVQARANTARLGRKPSCAMVSTAPPRAPASSASYTAITRFQWMNKVAASRAQLMARLAISATKPALMADPR